MTTKEYRVIITRTVMADSEEEAIQLATHEIERCSYSDTEAELVDDEPADDPVAWSGGFAPNH